MPIQLTKEQVAHINAMFAQNQHAETVMLVQNDTFVFAHLSWTEDNKVKNTDSETL